MKKRLLFFLIVLCVFGMVLIVVLAIRGKNNQTTILSRNLNSSVSPSLTPTPFPFQELTIPHLRSREYQSQLEDLEAVSENSKYKSYLTSYRSDGLKIYGLLTIPLGEEPAGGWPAIVFLHGYIPPLEYQTLQQYYDYVDYLARNGFVVFKIDLRGNGNSEGEPGGAYYSSDYIVDTLNAYAALQSAPFIDPRKIGLWGHSMAGNVVMRSFAAKPEIPAVVIWAGAVYTYTDMQEFGINDASYQPPGTTTNRARRRQQIRDLYGEPDSGTIFWQQLAPTNFLQDLKGAIQINHAADDPVVDIGYSRNLNSLLDKTSIPHELIEYPGGGHNLSGSTFGQAMQNTVEFFQKNLR